MKVDQRVGAASLQAESVMVMVSGEAVGAHTASPRVIDRYQHTAHRFQSAA